MPKADFFLILSMLAFGAGLGMFAVLGPLKKAIGTRGTEKETDF
jgi:hypothetical protein